MGVEQMRGVLKTEELREKLIPKFPAGCKRITPSPIYLQAFNRDNVQVITDRIEAFTEKGIKTKSKESDLDVIIKATGFSIFQSVRTLNATNQAGKSLQNSWDDEPRAYYGVTYPDFPNYFMILGPGTGLGHNSIIYIIECCVNYTADCIRKLQKMTTSPPSA